MNIQYREEEEARMKPVYDRIGRGYSGHRRADPGIADRIADLLGLTPPAVLADIGAGTGTYSRTLADRGFRVMAVEPSETMRRQAISHDSVEWYHGIAEDIPLPDHSVDGVFCILASHHFTSIASGAAEMARICSTGPILWFTFDPRLAEDPWIADYFPSIWEDAFRIVPPLRDVCRMLRIQTRRPVTVIPWAVPADLQDWFMAAGWRRPEIYLDPGARAGISAFARARRDGLQDGLCRLEEDCGNGTWKERYGHLLDRNSIDWGYRFLKAG